MRWTIENELCQLADADHVSTALVSLGIIEIGDRGSFSITKQQDWYRSGSETYSFAFNVSTKHSDEPLFLKACCPSSPATSLDETFDNWKRRREIFQANHIPTPRLYSARNALFLEERIPFHLTADRCRKVSPAVARNFVNTALSVFNRYRFSPTRPFSNLMSRGDDIVWIDFGEDLGGPSSSGGTEDAILSEARSFLTMFPQVN